MRTLALVLPASLVAAAAVAQNPTEPVRFEPPRTYVVARAAASPRIDGRSDEPEWSAAPWSADFADIEGSAAPPPALRTRVRLLWDDAFLYIAAELEEPHVWGTLTERDAVIYQDDDFEVFIDPDGDTHAYYELEINALGTVWDLLLTKPYRDGGVAIDHWDIRGLKSAVHVDGTIGDARAADRAWSVELAIPWTVLREAAPGGRAPHAGEQWRMNFSRVDWDMDVAGTGYRKRLDAATGKPLPEHNWVWSPQGAINMHMPERWGIVQFAAGGASDTLRADPHAAVERVLRELYYAQRRHHRVHGRYATALAELGDPAHAAGGTIALHPTVSGYEITARTAAGVTLHIREDGRTWRTGAAQ